MGFEIPLIFQLLPESWQRFLPVSLWESNRIHELSESILIEYTHGIVYPPRELLFRAFELTPPESVRVVILGQDPYHQPGQAHGLAFSVPPLCPWPPSLRNIFEELHQDLGCPFPFHGCLESWAKQGVFLLNSILTVRANQPQSHQGKGWEYFTDTVIQSLNFLQSPLVFILWGKNAQQKTHLIDGKRHLILSSAHPSPLSAYRGFFGSRPFSKTNAFLIYHSQSPIRWESILN